MGAILLLLSDTVTRAVLPHEIPIGALTALIGGPFFCFITTTGHKGGSNLAASVVNALIIMAGSNGG